MTPRDIWEGGVARQRWLARAELNFRAVKKGVGVELEQAGGAHRELLQGWGVWGRLCPVSTGL